MGKPVTLHRLRALARLHLDGAAGADEELLGLARDHTEQVADLIGVEHDRLARFLETDRAADGLVAFLRTVPKRNRDRQRRDRKDGASVLARDVAAHAVRDRYEREHLDAARLRRLATTAGYDWLDIPGTSEPRLFPRRLLGNVLRACQSARVSALYTEGDLLHVVYSTPRSRGRFQLQAVREPSRSYGPKRMAGDVVALPFPWLEPREAACREAS